MNDNDQCLVTHRPLIALTIPGKRGEVVCSLQKGVCLKVLETKQIRTHLKKELWINVSCGWINTSAFEEETFDEVFSVISEDEAKLQWERETQFRLRIASAITSMIVRSHSLMNAKRLVRTIVKHAHSSTRKAYVIPSSEQLSTEDIMITLCGQSGLKKAQIFHYMEVVASKQSDPINSIKIIADEIDRLIRLRPSIWVKDNLNVIETEQAKWDNDHFIMAAAGGDIGSLKRFLQNGKELTSLHSQLRYTCLHAAADFGQIEIAQELIKAGLSVNVKDARKEQTALHFAAQSGRIEIIEFLLSQDADRTIINGNGLLPYEVALKQGHIDCADALKFLPPSVNPPILISRSIDSLIFRWLPPLLNKKEHTPILQYHIRCVSVALNNVEESDLDSITNENNNEYDYYDQSNNSNTKELRKDSKMKSNQKNIKRNENENYYFKLDDYTNHYQLQYQVLGLMPNMQYSFKVRCRSKSGWSDFSKLSKGWTLPSRPSAPPPVEIIKISVNGLLTTFYPSDRMNGSEIDHYQLEVVDYNLSIQQEQAKNGLALPKINVDNSNSDKNNNDHNNDASIQLNNDNSSISSKNKHNINQSNKTESILKSHKKILPSFPPGSSNLPYNNMPSEIVFDNYPNIIDEDPIPIDNKGNFSKKHRILKHINLDYRFKYVTGLVPYRDYRIRIRCHNAIGYSPWSIWTGPIAPAPGVRMEQQNSTPPSNNALSSGTDQSVHISWFEPIIFNGQVVEAYELQMCYLAGPMRKSITVNSKEYNPRKNNIDEITQVEQDYSESLLDNNNNNNNNNNNKIEIEASQAEVTEMLSLSDMSHEYFTVSDTITSNNYIVSNLKPGGKYKFRVRMKYKDSDWFDWETCLMSEVLSVPSTIPDPPFHIRPSKLEIIGNNKNWKVHNNKEGEEIGHFNEQLKSVHSSNNNHYFNENFHTIKSRKDSFDGLEISDIDLFQYDITHNSITIEWTNGNSNGSPIIEYIIEMAMIRNFKIEDIVNAREAYSNIEIDNNSTVSTPNIDKKHTRKINIINNNNLHWINVTNPAFFINPQKYHVSNLFPGQTYTFRMKQRNQNGWSSYSNSSKIISTYPTLPPSQPIIIFISKTYLDVTWYTRDFDEINNSTIRNYNEVNDEAKITLSNLEYNVQVAVIHTTNNNNHNNKTNFNQRNLEWIDVSYTIINNSPNNQDDDDDNLSYEVRINDLIAGTCYVIRVRARSVLGWSTWSKISLSCRTLIH
eukprot:gene6935-9489_t